MLYRNNFKFQAAIEQWPLCAPRLCSIFSTFRASDTLLLKIVAITLAGQCAQRPCRVSEASNGNIGKFGNVDEFSEDSVI